MSRTEASAKLFADASDLIPGGVNSPVRAFNSVGGTPRFITSANGYWLTDADGNRYIDLVGSWGPMILGHAHPDVVAAVQRAAADGLSFGAPTPAESELAAEIIDGYGDVAVTADDDDPTVCRVSFQFAVAHGLNQIYLRAYITV